MGLPFSLSLQNFFDRVSTPFHAEHDVEPDEKAYLLLWDCYASGQMSDADLEHEIAADPGFADFIRRQSPPLH